MNALIFCSVWMVCGFVIFALANESSKKIEKESAILTKVMDFGVFELKASFCGLFIMLFVSSFDPILCFVGGNLLCGIIFFLFERVK